MNMFWELKNTLRIHWKLIFGNLIHGFLYRKKFYKKMSLKNPKTFKNKMLKKYPASNVWAAIFKKADFS